LPLEAWRGRAHRAAENGSADDVRAALDERATLRLPDEDTEIDVERLHGRLDLIALDERLARGELPVVATQHKAVGEERCCLVAPAVWCAADGDRPGKLFVTEHRVRFTGGPGFSLRWSALGGAVARDRDLLLLTVGGGAPRVIRCNSYSDARLSARLIEYLRNKA
jgi:hypothetical protein